MLKYRGILAIAAGTAFATALFIHGFSGGRASTVAVAIGECSSQNTCDECYYTSGYEGCVAFEGTCRKTGDAICENGVCQHCGGENEPVCPNNGTCGDGMMNSFVSEECDDGNTTDGDGCSAGCSVEAGWTCTSSQGDVNGWCGGQQSICGLSCDAHEDCPGGICNANGMCESACDAEWAVYESTFGPYDAADASAAADDVTLTNLSDAVENALADIEAAIAYEADPNFDQEAFNDLVETHNTAVANLENMFDGMIVLEEDFLTAGEVMVNAGLDYAECLEAARE